MIKRETPFPGGEKGDRLTKLLPKCVQNIHEDLQEIRREMYGESPRDFESKENSRLSNEECEKAATHHNTQRSHMPRISMREMEREEQVARSETLSDFLKEYESQTQKF